MDIIYNIENLIKKYNNEEILEYIFFWGHQPSKTGKITKSCLSQWWLSEFILEGNIFCCAEQYMMYKKALLFSDTSIALKILGSSTQKEIKALGRKVNNFDSKIWGKEKQAIVFAANIAKFSQNSNLKEFLIATKKSVLVEASPYDCIWGIGLRASDMRAKNPNYWRGLNLLGFILMQVRDAVRGEACDI